ncbi:hypothetical protein ASQ49_01705 [Acidipropionibacterium acidipropionici]|nr:hypothetical protein ASQ49_01705 [Acidipropionibacterium acidipropionici]
MPGIRGTTEMVTRATCGTRHRFAAAAETRPMATAPIPEAMTIESVSHMPTRYSLHPSPPRIPQTPRVRGPEWAVAPKAIEAITEATICTHGALVHTSWGEM